MTESQIVELDGFISVNIAQDDLRENKWMMNPEGVYKLALEATGDEFLARREWIDAVNRKMDSHGSI